MCDSYKCFILQKYDPNVDASDAANVDVKPDQVEVLPNEKVNVVDTKDSKKECENPESRSEEDVGGAGGG